MSSSFGYFPPQVSNNGFTRTKTISVTSGKGGVGKTTFLVNLSKALANLGKKVLILDGDFGMANVDIMFGNYSKSSLYDVVEGKKSLVEVISNVSKNIDLIPGGSGVYEAQNLTSAQRYILLNEVSELEKKYDYFILDTAPGISDNVLYLNSSVEEIMLILTPDPSSMADAYALIKVLNTRCKTKEINIICNMVKSEMQAVNLYNKLTDIADQFLNIRLHYKGFISEDLNLRHCTQNRRLVLDQFPKSSSSQSISKIAEKLVGYPKEEVPCGGLQFFWSHLFSVAS